MKNKLPNIIEISRDSLFEADYKGMKVEFQIYQGLYDNEPQYLIHAIDESYKFSNELETEVLESIRNMNSKDISFLWKKILPH